MERIHSATLLVLYQLTLLVGIVMLPFAVAARRVGIRLPIHRAITHLGDRYDRTRTA